MSSELVEASAAGVPATGGKPGLPELMERAGGAARIPASLVSHARLLSAHRPKPTSW
jgi:hypothetical protein